MASKDVSSRQKVGGSNRAAPGASTALLQADPERLQVRAQLREMRDYCQYYVCAHRVLVWTCTSCQVATQWHHHCFSHTETHFGGLAA